MSLSITGQDDLFNVATFRAPAATHASGLQRSLLASLMRTGGPSPLKRLAKRRPVHALLADADGVWAWSPSDPHAPATRHSGLRQWAFANAGRDMRLWTSSALARGQELDLKTLGEVDVRTRSVAPWWQHAFLEAKRCVHALNRAARARVCVVEGIHTTWVASEHGELREVQRLTLPEPTVDALQWAIRRMRDCPVTVALGQGLADGHRTGDLRALVLGRLDGQQPPQWLRPANDHSVN